MMRTLVATLSLSLLPALALADGPGPRPPTRPAVVVYTAFGGTYPFGSISGGSGVGPRQPPRALGDSHRSPLVLGAYTRSWAPKTRCKALPRPAGRL
jgi:hypothetical protein